MENCSKMNGSRRCRIATGRLLMMIYNIYNYIEFFIK